MRCLLINYDSSSQSLLRQYISRAGWQELILPTGPLEYSDKILTDCDLIFLHLASPSETLLEELTLLLKRHPAVVITSPFPKNQFPNLLIHPLAFLTEPFSFKKFSNIRSSIHGQAVLKVE